MPKISVIMPLYNAQKFLKESLDSVLNQTFQDFEFICINDASEDKTLSIVEEYQRNDSRIIILENGKRLGAAYSRNRGINQAKGKYIIFLDGDDIFEEEMLTVAYNVAEENDIDVLMFEYKHVTTEKIRDKQKVCHGKSFVKKYCNNVFRIKDGQPYEFLLWSTSPCNKLFKRDFIINNEIYFQTLSSSNDVYFVNMALMLSQRTMVLQDDRVMIYARDHKEPSRISIFRDPMCCFFAYEHLMDELIKRGQMENFYHHFFYKAIFSFKYALENLKDQVFAKQFYEFLQKDGIHRLLSKSSTYKKSKDEYLEILLKKLIQCAWDTRWMEDECILKACIKNRKEKFFDLFKQESSLRKTVLWGVGKNGKLVLEECEHNNITIDYVVDSDTKKQGQNIGKYFIMNPEIISKDDVFVIVSAVGAYDEIRKIIMEYNQNAIIVEMSRYLEIA